MNLQYFLTGAALMFTVTLNSQESNVPSQPIPCGQHNQQAKIYEHNPALRIQDSLDQIKFTKDYQNYLKTYDPFERAIYTIPVVVHVVHLNGVENISDEQIFNAIELLNKDFSMTNTDLSNTVAAFSGITGNANIEFKLATKDPNGNCHSGITRTVSATTVDTGMKQGSHPIVNAVAAAHGVWPQGDYMSIFVCTDPAGAAGYTFNPSNGFPQNQMRGAIFMRHDYMGVIGTSNSASGHTLSHEVGHWFNLSHLWGSSNSANVPSNCNLDDGVTDTPNTMGWLSCNLQGSTCGSLDNVQNIMEYSYCSTMFTQGQAARMQTALNSNVGGRSGLKTNANLAAAGVLTAPTDICEAKFIANTQAICAGQSVSFSDISVHAVTNRSWVFSGGSPASSADSVVDITYNTPGEYSVTLTVSNSSGSKNTTITKFIKVLAGSGTTLPYSEGFESLSGFPDDDYFSVINQNNDNTWEISSTAGSVGNKSVYLSNFLANTNGVDELISGPIDMTNVNGSDEVTFSFDYAYRKKESSNNEFLKVFVSADCGKTWSLKKSFSGIGLGNTIQSSNFKPIASEWKSTTVKNINTSFYVPEFRYKFVFESDNGNNIYIDNINISAPSYLSVPESDKLIVQKTIRINPNPASESSIVNLFGYQNSHVDISLYNVVGQKVKAIYNGNISASNFKSVIELSALDSGVYFVNVVANGKSLAVKLIKE